MENKNPLPPPCNPVEAAESDIDFISQLKLGIRLGLVCFVLGKSLRDGKNSSFSQRGKKPLVRQSRVRRSCWGILGQMDGWSVWGGDGSRKDTGKDRWMDGPTGHPQPHQSPPKLPRDCQGGTMGNLGTSCDCGHGGGHE